MSVQATIEALYLICQSVLYVCVLYFMAGFDKSPGKSLLITLQCLHKSEYSNMLDMLCMPAYKLNQATRTTVANMHTSVTAGCQGTTTNRTYLATGVIICH